MAENSNPSFHPFPRLPVELQDEIWNFAAASVIDSMTSTPEVYITTPLVLRPREGDFAPSLPLTVDTPWPSMAHACRNSRAVLLRSRYFKLRCHYPSQLYKHEEGIFTIGSRSSTNYNTTLQVPYRLFNPEIDIFYWSAWQSFAMTTSYLRRHQQSQSPNRQGHIATASLRSIAVEIGALFPPSELAELLRRDAPYITSLTLILPAGTLDPAAGGLISDFAHDTRGGIPPFGRCRIRLLTAAERGKVRMMGVPFGPTGLGITRLEDFLQERKKALEEHVVAWQIRPPAPSATLAESANGNDATVKRAWDESTERFDELDIHVGVFEEWTRTEGKRWVEPKPTDPGKYRLLRYIPVSERRDPQRFRVLDDEMLDSTEEYTRSHGWTDSFR
ncbi:hypothetical protein V8F33_013244 [Rhypophila sp. PSN 637]